VFRERERIVNVDEDEVKKLVEVVAVVVSAAPFQTSIE
jgi:hypothetical protein